MTTLLFLIVIAAALVGLVAVWGLYAKKKIELQASQLEVQRLQIAIGVATGYLDNLTTSGVPGTDGAYVVLDRITQLVEEKK